MKFGCLSLAEAEGAVLAHGVRVANARFKKGRVLTAEDLSTLADGDVTSVVAARLDIDDVPEDAAARAVAEALGGPGVRVGAPFTGRCNVYALERGLLELDAARIHAINLIDEAVTVATLREHLVVAERQMVATVKIIPFSVTRQALQAVLDQVNGGVEVCRERVLAVAPFKARVAVLVQTELPGIKASVLDKTRQVLQARLAALGATLALERRCAHDPTDLAAVLRDLGNERHDLLLVAGASAIVDRHDVIPSALTEVGGEVIRFGMPVDPGNLLLVGRWGDADVIGLPGCARSPKFNGLDFVLQRLCAGKRVGSGEVARLGVGGLLKEYGARPQPRGAEAMATGATGDDALTVDDVPKAPRIAAVLLAGGQSRRMGQVNKLLEPVGGTAMLRRVVDTLVGSDIDEIVVVTGHEAPRVHELLDGVGVRFVHNPDYGNGLSTSLKTGIAATETLVPAVDAVLVVLGDMPMLSCEVINRLISAFDLDEGREICVPVHGGKRGNPVLWGRRFLSAMAELRGDVGAKHLIGEHDEALCEVPVPSAAVLLDIDTPDALDRLRRGEKPRRA